MIPVHKCSATAVAGSVLEGCHVIESLLRLFLLPINLFKDLPGQHSVCWVHSRWPPSLHVFSSWRGCEARRSAWCFSCKSVRQDLRCATFVPSWVLSNHLSYALPRSLGIFATLVLPKDCMVLFPTSSIFIAWDLLSYRDHLFRTPCSEAGTYPMLHFFTGANPNPIATVLASLTPTWHTN